MAKLFFVTLTPTLDYKAIPRPLFPNHNLTKRRKHQCTSAQSPPTAGSKSVHGSSNSSRLSMQIKEILHRTIQERDTGVDVLHRGGQDVLHRGVNRLHRGVDGLQLSFHAR